MKRLSLAAMAILLSAVASAGLAEFGIEGMGVVSTPDSEVRASVSPDGHRIVWGSTNRKGGPGGWDIWQASLSDGRWAQAQPLPAPVNSEANDFDPLFSADGKWLYFFSNRDGGFGSDDLYRAAVHADGSFGHAENLGAGVNGKGAEFAPTPSRDGHRLLFASNSFGGAGRHDLFVAHWNGKAFVEPMPVPGINTPADEFDAAWIDDGKAIVYAQSKDVEKEPIRLMIARCDGKVYVDAAPWSLPFNTADGFTLGPVVDASKPSELLVSGMARSPKAGRMDIYRVRAPSVAGKSGCLAFLPPLKKGD